MGMRNFAWVKLLASALIWLATAIAAPAWAQSACTAVWGAVDLDATGTGIVTELRYFNRTTNLWSQLSPNVVLSTAGGAAANSLAVNPTTGDVWYVDRGNSQIHRYNLNSTVDTNLGAFAAPPNGAGNVLGGVFSGPTTYHLYAPVAASVYVGRIDTSNPTVVTWTQVLTTGGGVNPITAGLGTSGDIFTNNAGNSFIISRGNPSSVWSLDLNPLSATYARTTLSFVITGTLGGTPTIGGVAIDPTTGNIIVGTYPDIPVASTTYSVNPGTGAGIPLEAQKVYGIADMSSCPAPPLAPSVIKSFSPTFSALTGGTTTLSIFFRNLNFVPVWLDTAFVDSLPAGMSVSAVPNLNRGACDTTGLTTITNVITATAGLGTLTFAAGGRIPAGGCTVSFVVTAPAATATYTNNIPIGSLTTTAGSNPAATSASFKVGTDFTAAKAQCAGICGTPTSAALSLGSGQTMQYVLTITNSTVGGTGSATFTDTLPTLITPVLSITAASTGGGICTTASAVIGGATRITGTFANAPAGAQCVVTVTGLISAQASATTVTNTLTLAPTAGTSDTNAGNNSATVVTNPGPATNLTITKTNGTNTVAAGSTTNYTITVANFGPANAPNSIVKDPAVTGLTCSNVTCAPTAGTAVCPTGAALTVPLLQGAGVSIPTFNAGSTLTFVVTCGVTATGQ
jgi:uncharacterized repeat protein (TIGR01451 family)